MKYFSQLNRHTQQTYVKTSFHKTRLITQYITYCILQHVPQSAHTVSTKKLLRMDRYGPKHVELTPEY